MYGCTWIKIWLVYFNLTDAQSIHGELESQGQSSDGIPYVTGSDGFSVQQITKVVFILWVIAVLGIHCKISVCYLGIFLSVLLWFNGAAKNWCSMPH